MPVMRMVGSRVPRDRMSPRDRRRGSILAETVLVMPLLLLLIFGIIQFAQICMARQFVVYAAACAARAMTVVQPSEQDDAADKAAKLALSWLCLAEADSESSNAGVEVPGWGLIPGSRSVDRRVTTTTFCHGDDDAEPYVGVRVGFRFPLLIPGMAINTIIGNFADTDRNQPLAQGADFYGNLAQASRNPIVDIDGWPYINFTETCILPMPYSPKNFPKGGYDGCRINGFGGGGG